MKALVFIPALFLSGCASMESLDEEFSRTQCPIGYHEEQISAISFSKKSKSKDAEKKSRVTEEYRCAANTDQHKFLNHK